MSQFRSRLEAALADRYTIEREIGTGGMATVYVATDLRHQRRVAVKVLRPDLAATLGAERFLQEVRVTANLQHPHILPLFDSGEANGFLYFVMPYIEGESLRQRLAREGELPVHEAVRLLRDVVDALAAAHSKGVVHRDVKPANVMLSGHHAMLTDFGVAKAVSDATGRFRLTSEGIALGTPTYMAPEQAAGEPNIDRRADVYAVGVLAYELLTGRPPFTGVTAQQVLTAQVMESPTPIRKHRAAVPQALEAMITRCLEKKPADRWQSCEEMLPHLEALATTGGITPTDLPAVAGIARRKRRVRTWIVTAAVFGAASIAAVSWLGRTRGARPAAAAVSAPERYAATVAVLPFDNYGAAEDDYVAEGLAEDIIRELAQRPSLKVISRTSVVALKHTGLTLPEIADTLGVRHVLEGSVTRAGNRIRISVQLIDAQSDNLVWAKSYDRDMSDVLAVRDEISRRVVEALLTKVTGAVQQPSDSPPAEAYDAYLNGRYWLNRRTPEGLRRAVESFRKAVGLDSTFAGAYAGIATAQMLAVTYAYPGSDAYVRSEEALEAADRAIAIDSSVAEAYAARGYVLRYLWAPSALARSDLERAIGLEPQNSDAHGWYGHLLARDGAYERAMSEHDSAVALDPLAPGRHTGYAFDAILAGRPEVALEQAQRALALESGLADPKAAEALALLLLDRAPECLHLQLGAYRALRALCLYSAGRPTDAAALADSVARDLGANPDLAGLLPLTSLALYDAWTGDAAGALSHLEAAIRLSPDTHLLRLVDSPLFAKVASSRSFKAGVARMRREVWRRFEHTR